MRAVSGSAGYTLVETLASLTILALLSVLVVDGTHFARLKLARTESLDQGQAIEAAQGLLRERLQRSFPYAQFFSTSPTISFDGVADRVSFVAPPPDAAAPDVLQHYGLGLATDGSLRLSMVSDLANDPTRPAQTLVLLRDVASLDVAYFGAMAPDGQPQWRRRWQQQPSLPRLVRVRVAFHPGDQRVWPDLIVNPAATLDSLCQIEANTGECRGRS